MKKIIIFLFVCFGINIVYSKTIVDSVKFYGGTFTCDNFGQKIVQFNPENNKLLLMDKNSNVSKELSLKLDSTYVKNSLVRGKDYFAHILSYHKREELLLSICIYDWSLNRLNSVELNCKKAPKKIIIEKYRAIKFSNDTTYLWSKSNEVYAFFDKKFISKKSDETLDNYTNITYSLTSILLNNKFIRDNLGKTDVNWQVYNGLFYFKSVQNNKLIAYDLKEKKDIYILFKFTNSLKFLNGEIFYLNKELLLHVNNVDGSTIPNTTKNE